MKVYLDVSCLNRPFDDLSQDRVALEAVAVTAILALIDAGRLADVSSEVAQIKIDRTPDTDRRRKATALLPPRERIIPLTNELLETAEKIVSDGFDLADAVHLAAARELRVDACVTSEMQCIWR